MQTFKQTVQVPRQILILLNRWLSIGEAVEESGKDEILYKSIALFDKNIEAVIPCVNAPDGPYIEATLFPPDGRTVACQNSPAEHFHGAYTFVADGDQYAVVVECEK